MSLVDRYQRRIDYLRVSVTDRCDLRCTYCLPQSYRGMHEPAHWLTHDEMLRLITLLVEMGISKVRLTGGEPLMRRGASQLAHSISLLPKLLDLSLSTNATTLNRHAIALKHAGVHRLNISLDTLSRQRFLEITGRDALVDVLAGIDAAIHVGFEVIKLNTVVQPSTTIDDMADIMRYALERGLVLRLIEVMPMGHSGRSMSTVNVTELAQTMAQQFGLIPQIVGAQVKGFHNAGPARYWVDPQGRMSLGAITPMSQHFCETCNRIRLAVDGTLYLCLGQDETVPLGTLLRDGASDEELRHAILEGISHKPERHDFLTRPQQVLRFMAHTGG